MDQDACQTIIVQLPNQSILYDVLRELNKTYHPIHTYLSIILCIFGGMTNTCNIVILTRKEMRSPVNTILTAMACCDTIVLFSNLVYTTHYSFVAFKSCQPKHWSYGWAVFLIVHAHLSLIGHTCSVWLSVMLALIRYLTLKSRGNSNSTQIGTKHSFGSIVLVSSLVLIVNFPNFMTYKIEERSLQSMCEVVYEKDQDTMAFLPGIAEMATANNCFIFRAAFWLSGMLYKVVPCICLTILVFLLLRILKEVKENHARLLKSSQHGRQINGYNKTKELSNNRQSSIGSSNVLHRGNSIRATSRGERTDRTTHMLLAIVAVLLVTEMPQGIMAVLSGVFSEEFRIHVYNNLGDLLDLLSLCGACTSFIIYCSMSGAFRYEFRRVFIPSRVIECFGGERGRRTSEAYTKMTMIRPSELNNSDHDRSIAITVVGSSATVRKERGTPPSIDISRTPLTPLTPISPPPINDYETKLIQDRNGRSS